MNPRAIEVHIEELILHGFEPGVPWNVADALESELRGLLDPMAPDKPTDCKTLSANIAMLTTGGKSKQCGGEKKP